MAGLRQLDVRILESNRLAAGEYQVDQIAISTEDTGSGAAVFLYLVRNHLAIEWLLISHSPSWEDQRDKVLKSIAALD